MGFWDKDLFGSSVETPRQLLELAAKELEEGTKTIQVQVQKNDLSDRTVLSFIISHPPFPLIITLFEAAYQLDKPYPATLIPPPSEIPIFLQRVVRKAPIGSLTSPSFARLLEGEVVENKWVCSTPNEFREKLKELLSMDQVKSKVVGLLSYSNELELDLRDALQQGSPNISSVNTPKNPQKKRKGV